MPDNVLIERENSVYTSRKSQLEINIAAWRGGRDYVNKRLERYPAEEDLSWQGGVVGGNTVTGRKQQALCIPLCGRLVEKSNQYLFSKTPKRTNARDQFVANATRDGVSLQALFEEINAYLTATKWCWLGVDMPRVDSQDMSIADKEQLDIRPYWQVYSPLDVVDWSFDSRGQLLWLITAGKDEVANDPWQKTQSKPYRILWEPGRATKIYYEDKGNTRKVDGLPLEFEFNYSAVPFVLCGKISKLPILFDDLETLQRAMMNLVSSHHQNIFSCVYPQMVLPASMVQNDDDTGKAAGYKTLQVGLKHPLSETIDDANVSRYIAPPAEALAPLEREIVRVKNDFFDLAGFMLRKETRAAESGESKMWDAQDAQKFFEQRAKMLEDIERKAIEISNAWDSWFTVYEPEYSKDFNVENFIEDMQVMSMASGISMPDEMYRMLLKQMFNMMQKMAEQDVDPAEIKTVTEAIEQFAKTTSFIPTF